MSAIMKATLVASYLLAHAVSEEPTLRTSGKQPYFVVPLRRESVPVLHNGKLVSHKTAYAGTISVGISSPQQFSVVFDTGSGHVVLPSQACASATCAAHRRYNISASPAARRMNLDGEFVVDDDLPDQVTIGYGTGWVTGEFVKESVCLGDTHGGSSGASCASLNMVAAVDMSAKPFDSFSFDGIFGLGLKGLALSEDFSFFSRLFGQAEAPSMQVQRFGFFLTAGDTSETEPSELTVGGHDDRRLLGPLTWAAVSKPHLGYWQVRIRAIRIGDFELPGCRTGACHAVLDTGTSHLGVPRKHIDNMRDLLTSTPGDAADCRSVEAPRVSIELHAGLTLTLEPQDYMPKGSPATSRSPATDLPTCRPKVMPVNMQKPLGQNLFILGEPVLHRYYTVYDWREQRVGFGLANNRRNRGDAEAPLLLGGDSSNDEELDASPAGKSLEPLDIVDEEPHEKIFLLQVDVSVVMF